ncbi:CTL-like protein [Auxenochlorella protothecoides]|uniref:Choline transporter-like protein n=1 Tax=Auxenochlorella protothecoides TaxID=3075 RepID=A0A087SEH7_AUXPR|nr:CTL-like protein [Auxenochlorella protothecoides]KFM24131.1 CTL-like protein [Auxenochlorella protothecoides]
MGLEELQREGETLVASAGPYQFTRSRKDAGWGVAFGLAYAAVVVAGIYGYVNRNPDFALINQDYLSDPENCPLHGGRRLREAGQGDLPAFDAGEFMSQAAGWLGAGVALSLLLGAAFLRLFQHLPETMTRATVLIQVAAPLAVGAGMLGSGQGRASLLPLGLAALSGLAFYLWRAEIGLASRLLGVSAHGLAANPHLITTSVLLGVASVATATPLAAALVLSFMNGDVVPNPGRDLAAAGGACLDEAGDPVLCCAWGVDPWVKPAAALGALAMLWTLLLANQVRVYVISGTVAQWYFAPPGALHATRGTTRCALGHAFGPSFGSLALSSLVLTITEALRNSAERNAQENQDVLSWVMSCIAQCLAGIVEYLTKFATVFMAITGDAFFAAGRRVTDLLARNLLDAFASTIWFTPMVIQLAAFSMAVGWGFASGGVYYLAHRGAAAGVEASPGLNAAVLGGMVGLASLFLLNFLGGVLLAVLDAAFVCWALDRDAQSVSHPEIAQAFDAVPRKGAVVEQPGGGLAYGGLAHEAPAQQRV